MQDNFKGAFLMDDFNKENNLEGEITGFDSAEKNETGYTVTPEGGFYTKKQDEKIHNFYIQVVLTRRGYIISKEAE